LQPALGAEVNNAASRVYAVEGSCFVLAPCATVSQAMIEELCDRRISTRCCMPAAATLRSTGRTAARSAKKLAPDQEGLLIAEIDLGLIGIAKNAADPAGLIRGRMSRGCFSIRSPTSASSILPCRSMPWSL